MKRTLSIVASVVTGLGMPLPVSAVTVNLGPPNGPVSPSAAGIPDFVRFVINGLVFIGIIAALAFLIYGGIKWIMSGGDKSAVESARNHIIAAIIGLVVILLAWVILNIVFTLLGAGNLTSTLNVPTL